ncbi:MAG: imidazoleglycerol-phosphate dehydratase HisB [Alphaproteobacteria bacterium]|nr:imidazoleglycerol-phosphate dehydratase HisB [Alphaproteobacteria bacterium]
MARPPAPRRPAAGGDTRRAEISRATKETTIRVAIDLDGSGRAAIGTGIGFLDHMLEQVARHGLIDITIEAKGDLHIDYHHTTEDVGIALGQALAAALGEKRGIRRYGSCLSPMDEALVQVALDISGRAYLVWDVAFSRPKLGEMDTELFREWFQAFAANAGITLHVRALSGENNHHIAEACFKGLARALREAVALDPRQAGRVPSTKGTLGKGLGTAAATPMRARRAPVRR